MLLSTRATAVRSWARSNGDGKKGAKSLVQNTGNGDPIPKQGSLVGKLFETAWTPARLAQVERTRTAGFSSAAISPSSKLG